MEIPRNNKELGVFLVGFFGSAFILLAALFALSFSRFTPRASGMAVGSSDVALGLFALGVITGLVVVVKWRQGGWGV
jgi:hypothetical protein